MRGLYEESDGRRIFLPGGFDLREVAHFLQDGSVFRRVVLVGDHPERQGVFLRNVFLLADVADGRYDLFRQFEPAQQRLVYLPCFGHALDHDRLACLAGCQVLPDLFGDERHEGV